MLNRMSTDESESMEEATASDNESEVLLKATDLTKTFSGLVALEDVSLNVNRGEIVGLIGPNGAGKTTLFNCVSGVLSPTDGIVELNGEDITGDAAHHVAHSGLARTFQITRPLEDLTVLENVLVGAHIRTRRRHSAEEIAKAQLQFVGLESRVGEKASELTVGDQKRLELARALATEPDILLLDEIMAGLTPTETRRMLDLFKDIRGKDVSILIIEHDMEAIMEISDRVKVLDSGEAIAFGPPEAVANDERVIEAYIGGDTSADPRLGDEGGAENHNEDATGSGPASPDSESMSGFMFGGEARRNGDTEREGGDRDDDA